MKYTKDNPLRVVTLFSGYDSQCLALNKLKAVYPQFDYELVAWCEIDKDAIAAHNSIYPQWENRNLGDISKTNVNDIPDCDLMTWSFPCTDISSAGRQAGLSKDSGTRSSLAWEAIRLFRAKRPKYLLMENVKALVQRKFIGDFKTILLELEGMGYANFSQVLDASKYGVAQHRERVFCVSILRDPKKPEPSFHFPKPFPLEKRLKDYLEENADEKYYLSDKMLEYFNRVDAEDSLDGEDTSSGNGTVPGNRVDDNIFMDEEDDMVD